MYEKMKKHVTGTFEDGVKSKEFATGIKGDVSKINMPISKKKVEE